MLTLLGAGQGVSGDIPYILDTYSGAAAAYSLQQLSSSTTKVVRVRRSSDNSEQNFTATQITDGTLLAFCGVGNGFVTTIYDQVGTNHFTQSNASRQGTIVISGALLLLNSKPVIIRSTDDNGGYISNYAPNGATAKGLFYVGSNNSKTSLIFGSWSGGQDYGYSMISGSTLKLVNFSPDVVVSNEIKNGSPFVYITRGDAYTALQNQFLLSADVVFNFVSNQLALGYRFTNPSNTGMCSFQEMIIFDNTNNTTEKNNNINSRYNIY
ncbi:hypothetical protein [Flavobacterium sp.]|uniref:hypothetical protein n=2 Tax=Flavobacterium sp. TaxID=239 RepID=UPI004047D806